MEFVHCNWCGFHPTNIERRRFYITSCGHVFCDQCAQGRPSDENCLVPCLACKILCRYVEVCSNAKPEIKCYFRDPMDALKESFGNTVQVMNFQRGQMRSFSEHVSKLMANQRQLEAENKLLKDQVAQLKKQISSGQSNSTGMRLSQLGPGRLTLPPHTPQRVNAQRQYSPTFVSQGSRGSTPGSTFSVYGTPSSGTPDITSRLRQLQCFSMTGSSKNGQHHSQQRQFS